MRAHFPKQPNMSRILLACTLVACVVVAATAKRTYVLNEKIIDTVNSNPDSTWVAGTNTFFDGWTVEKAASIMGTLKDQGMHKLPRRDYTGVQIPSEFSAKTEWPNCIGPILNQAECGSCWAFGCAEAISDRVCISANSTFVQRAPLDLVSCDYGVFGNNGCQGGQLSTAWQYAQQYGLVSEKCLPYLTSEGGPIPTCPPSQQPCMPNTFVPTPKCNKSCADGGSFSGDKLKISSVYGVSGVQNIAGEIMKNGPVEAAFTVYADFVHYKSGVYSHQTGDALGGHAIKIIGWGTEQGAPYWLVQNSWTTSWGMDGYFKIARGQDECGIEDNVVAGSV